jgi:RNA polymerase sigma-70 factor (ECF subfamily)
LEVEEFCRQAHPRLVGALAHHFGDVGLAEELANEALVRAWERWSRVSKLDSPEGWAYRVGVNLGRSRLRRRRAEARARDRLGAPRSSPLPDEFAEVSGALAALKDRDRQVILLRHYFGLSAEETATVLGTSPGNVRVMTHRALARLRADLAIDDPLEEPETQHVA